MNTALPPAWPTEVPPPGTPGWTRGASAWLFDLCPHDYRAYEVLRAHPLVLARLADEHLQAAIEAARHGLATARADLRDLVPPEAVVATLTMYERESARLAAARRAVDAVGRALRGERYVPKL